MHIIWFKICIILSAFENMLFIYFNVRMYLSVIVPVFLKVYRVPT